MNILGISAFYHDSAAAIVSQGEIIAAAQEERFTRKKHDPAFPSNAVRFCIEYSGITLDKIDAVAFYDKPLLKFERLLETYNAYSPNGLNSFLAAMPVWLKEKMFLKKLIRDELAEIDKVASKKVQLLFPEHHLSHAASAFYPSPFQDAAIITIDGVGEWATTTICKGEGSHITILKEMQFPHSLGLLYSSVTYYCGFKVNSGEYKLMGLAPYGNAGSSSVEKIKKSILDHFIEIKNDGSIFLNQQYFNYATGLRMADDEQWEKVLGFPRREKESFLDQRHCDFALAIQEITEEVVIKLAQETKNLTGSKNLCLAGGVALNCVANGKLQNKKIFENIFIQPAAGDAGGSLGAALAANYIYFEKERRQSGFADEMKGSFLGPEYSSLQIEMMSRKFDAVYNRYDNTDEMSEKVARLIDAGNVIGWFQGRMEFGPRALGARSIIADPRNAEMQKKLNLKIKFREGFRPFAPSVMAEHASDYFELDSSSPYMLLVQPVNKNRQKPLPANYADLEIMDKLYIERSDLPAITHVDYSARIQTVHEETNPRYYNLLKSFNELTGCPVLINTSFNVRGEPLVGTPEDAYRCFMRTEMDYLVIGDYLFDRNDQPQWVETEQWKTEFEPD